VYFNGNQHHPYDGWWNYAGQGWLDQGFNQYFMAQFDGTVPEPSTLILCSSSLLGALAIRRRFYEIHILGLDAPCPAFLLGELNA
jgi:hypothetical protein